MTLTDTLIEQAYHVALHAIASGCSRSETKAALMPETRLTLGQIDRAMADAKKDALASGVEREDMDDSWFK